jgi:hypothetical protein
METATQKIKTNTLVALEARKLNGRTVTVCPPVLLQKMTISSDLADAGWQLAEFRMTGVKVFVRATDETKHVGSSLVRKVEIRDVATVTEFVPQHLRRTDCEYAICAGLGDPRPTGWTHEANVEVA